MLQALDKILNFTATLQGRSYRFHFTEEEMEPGDAESLSRAPRGVVDLGARHKAGHWGGVGLPSLCIWLRPLGA